MDESNSDAQVIESSTSSSSCRFSPALAPEPCSGSSETPLSHGPCGLSSSRGRRVGESDGIGAGPARLGRHFRLFERVEVGLCCVRGLDDHRHSVAYRGASSFAESIAEVNEEAPPTVPDIAVELCSICGALHEPAVATPSKPKGLLAPNSLGVEWDDCDGDSLVALNKPRFKTCFAHGRFVSSLYQKRARTKWWSFISGELLDLNQGCATGRYGNGIAVIYDCSGPRPGPALSNCDAVKNRAGIVAALAGKNINICR